MYFAKMQGCGNDYIFIDNTGGYEYNKSLLAEKTSDRHFGVGSDGVIFIEKSDTADFRMDFYNSDGSKAEMCGTAARCLARFVYERRLTEKKEIEIDTLAGTRTATINMKGDRINSVTVAMGSPVFDARKIPVKLPLDRVIKYPFTVGEDTYYISAVSMGNPHAVILCEDIGKLNLNDIGRTIENHPIFPSRTNVEFISIYHNEILMRVWERGAGETLSCGTGACAAAVIACEVADCDETVKVYTKGGSLSVNYDKKNQLVFLTGPAEFVFEGEFFEPA